MPVTVELTYDMSKELGLQRFEIDGVETVGEVVRQARERFGDKGETFDQLEKRTAVAVNGVLANHRRRHKTRLADGDTVTFVKAASGG